MALVSKDKPPAKCRRGRYAKEFRRTPVVPLAGGQQAVTIAAMAVHLSIDYHREKFVASYVLPAPRES